MFMLFIVNLIQKLCETKHRMIGRKTLLEGVRLVKYNLLFTIFTDLIEI